MEGPKEGGEGYCPVSFYKSFEIKGRGMLTMTMEEEKKEGVLFGCPCPRAKHPSWGHHEVENYFISSHCTKMSCRHKSR